MSKLRVALVQLAADQDVTANIDRAAALIRRAGEHNPNLVALPEMFQYRGPLAGFRESATDVPGPLTETFSDLARELKAWILLGSPKIGILNLVLQNWFGTDYVFFNVYSMWGMIFVDGLHYSPMAAPAGTICSCSSRQIFSGVL